MTLSPASSRGGTASGSVTLLSTTTLAADGVFDVTSIDQSYNDLLMVLIARGTRAANADFLQLRLNNDSGAGQYDGVNTAGGPASTSLAQTSGRLSGSLPAATATAGDFAQYEIQILGYTSTVWRKTVTSLAGAPTIAGTTMSVEIGSVFWNSTAAIGRIGFFGGTTANLLAGSTLRIYGRT